jgi:hypothetical protein
MAKVSMRAKGWADAAIEATVAAAAIERLEGGVHVVLHQRCGHVGSHPFNGAHSARDDLREVSLPQRSVKERVAHLLARGSVNGAHDDRHCVNASSIGTAATTADRALAADAAAAQRRLPAWRKALAQPHDPGRLRIRAAGPVSSVSVRDRETQVSAPPRRLDRGDVDPSHRHHRVERPLGRCAIGVGHASGERAGVICHESPTCLDTSACAFLPAISDDSVPQAIGFGWVSSRFWNENASLCCETRPTLSPTQGSPPR